MKRLPVAALALVLLTAACGGDPDEGGGGEAGGDGRLVIATTVAPLTSTPMVMPSMVRAARSLLAASERRAMRRFSNSIRRAG